MPGIWQNFRIFRCVLLIELQAKLQLMHRFIYGADRFPMSAEIVRGMLQMILFARRSEANAPRICGCGSGTAAAFAGFGAAAGAGAALADAAFGAAAIEELKAAARINAVSISKPIAFTFMDCSSWSGLRPGLP